MIPTDHLSVHRAYTQLKEFLGDDAFGRLINLLRAGTLTAYSVDANNNVKKCDPVFWMNIDNATRQQIFESVVMETRAHAFARKEIVVREDEFNNTIGMSARVSGDQSPETSRGRRPKYEWDAIWCGIVSGIDGWGRNPTQSDVISRVQDWFEESFPGLDVPSESILQPKISKMLQILKGQGSKSKEQESIRLLAGRRSRRERLFEKRSQQKKASSATSNLVINVDTKQDP